ncbi:MAG: hypothetical protein GY847_25525 [Proteobacteria bacterium]|nr:hypothetical protein [Pseudomonadota bacterium]
MVRGREGVVQSFLALLVVTPALVLGAVHVSILAFYVLVASALFICLAISKHQGSVRLDLPGAILLGLTLFTLLQLIPLPSSIVELISPVAYEVRSRALKPLGAGPPSFMPLTLDSTLTAQELGKLIIYMAVYWTCSLWTRQHGSKFVLNLVVVTGIAAATVFLAHRILLMDKVYGIYTPVHLAFGTERCSAPLINENHLAGLLGICSAVAIGRALAVHDHSKRILSIGVAGLIGASLLLTLSRGGIAAFVCGQCIFVLIKVVQRLRRSRTERASQHMAWLPLGLACSLGLGLFAAQDVIIGEFVRGNTKKLEFVFEGLPLIGHFWTTGVGRGAFWVGFPLVSDLAMASTFTHAENAIVQILADYGLLVGGLALIGVSAVFGRLLLRLPKRTEHVAALVALLAFGLHNTVDFNMEIPGVAVLAVALLGTLQGNHSQSRLNIVIPRPVMAVFAAGALITVATTWFFVADHGVDQEERSYRKAWAKRDPKPFTDENLTDVLMRHPADWYIPFLVGVRHYNLGSANPLPWLARAIELNSVSAPAHLYIGRTFLRAGKLSQAMLEFRLAALFNPGFAIPVSRFLVSKIPNFEQLSSIAVTKEDKLLLWGALAQVLASSGHHKEAEEADKAILVINPLEPRSLARHARRLANREKTTEALNAARKLAFLPDYGPSSALIQAEIYKRQKQHEKAIAVLEKELVHSPRHRGLLSELAWSRQRAGDHKGALKAVASLRALALNIKSRANAAVLEANLSAAEGRIQAALAGYREAHLLDPSNLSILKRTASLAEQHGDKQRAIEALRKLANADPNDTSIQNRLKQFEEAENYRRLVEP